MSDHVHHVHGELSDEVFPAVPKVILNPDGHMNVAIYAPDIPLIRKSFWTAQS